MVAVVMLSGAVAEDFYWSMPTSAMALEHFTSNTVTTVR
jgi:hypothetical protein